MKNPQFIEYLANNNIPVKSTDHGFAFYYQACVSELNLTWIHLKKWPDDDVRLMLNDLNSEDVLRIMDFLKQSVDKKEVQ